MMKNQSKKLDYYGKALQIRNEQLLMSVRAYVLNKMSSV